MDLQDVAEGLAANAATVVPPTGLPKVTPYAYMPESVTEPAVVVGEVDIDFDQTFRRGLDQFLFTVRALVGHQDDRAAQEYLNALMKGSGSTSLKAAIESDKTLGGAAHDLHVQRVRGRRLYTWGSKDYIGCELVVLVIGPGS